MNHLLKKGVILLLLLFAALPLSAGAADSKPLSLPQFTETDCVWNDAGDVISETAHDLNGRPAVNSRGFHRAEYTWDSDGNLLSEAYFGLNGEPVAAEGGYARTEFTYVTDLEGKQHVLTEDRYAPDGTRANIPGGYSYRRDTWSDGRILMTAYYDSEGKLTRPTGGYALIVYDITNAESGASYTVTTHYLNTDGSPLVGPEGGATVVSTYTTNLYLTKGIRVEELARDLHEHAEHEQEEDKTQQLLLSQ